MSDATLGFRYGHEQTYLLLKDQKSPVREKQTAPLSDASPSFPVYLLLKIQLNPPECLSGLLVPAVGCDINRSQCVCGIQLN